MTSIFEPIMIGNVQVKNRMWGAPMGSSQGDDDGWINQKLIDMYAERAKGGWGLVTVEATWVRWDGTYFPRLISIGHDKRIMGLSELADAIKENGAMSSIQLWHAGVSCSLGTHVMGFQPISPSGLPANFCGVQSRSLSTGEVEELVECYAQAGRRAKQAGFDMVELHAAHSYLIHEFISP